VARLPRQLRARFGNRRLYRKNQITKASIVSEIPFNVAGVFNQPIQFDTVEIDDYNMVGPGPSFTIPTTGHWRITYNICFWVESTALISSGGEFLVIMSKTNNPGPVLFMKSTTDIGSDRIDIRRDFSDGRHPHYAIVQLVPKWLQCFQREPGGHDRDPAAVGRIELYHF